MTLPGGARQGQNRPEISMLQLPTDLPGISLALSLHAPTQEVRRTIVPSAQAYPLDKLIAAVDKYQLLTRQRVSSSLHGAFMTCFAHFLWQPTGCRLGPAQPSWVVSMPLQYRLWPSHVPIAYATEVWPLQMTIDHVGSTQNADTRLSLLLQIFVEYVMLAGVNDSAEQAHQLGRLLQGRDLVINLIPWNPVYSPDFSYEVNFSSSDLQC